MNYLKMLGLAVLATAALAASASATTLTSPAGTTLGEGAKVKAKSFSLQTHGVATIECETSTFEGQIEKAGGASETVRIPLSSLSFIGCGVDTITLLKPGALEVHTNTASADGNGAVTWSGGEITYLTHRKVLGFLFTSHCIYYSEDTHLGTLTGSKTNAGKEAVLDLSGAALPLRETSPGCEPVTWTGSFALETPNYLDVD